MIATYQIEKTCLDALEKLELYIDDFEESSYDELDFNTSYGVDLRIDCTEDVIITTEEPFEEFTIDNLPICFSLNMALTESKKRRGKNSVFEHEQLEKFLILLDFIAFRNEPLSLAFFDHATYSPVIFTPNTLHKRYPENYPSTPQDYKDFLEQGHVPPSAFIPKGSTVYEIILLSLKALSIWNMHLNKCELCGKYFVPTNRSDEKYCDFENAEYRGRTCKEASRLIKQKERESNNEVLILSKKIYNRLRARSERSQSEKDLQILFKFQTERDMIKDSIKLGEAVEDDLLTWLRKKEIETKARD